MGLYSDGKHKVGDKVWVYEFYRLSGHEGHFHNVKPQSGLIVGFGGLKDIEKDCGSDSLKEVVLYKTKKGQPTDELSKKSFGMLQVKLADSYEEAVEEYNKLVSKEVNFYREKLEQVESYIIK